MALATPERTLVAPDGKTVDVYRCTAKLVDAAHLQIGFCSPRHGSGQPKRRVAGHFHLYFGGSVFCHLDGTFDGAAAVTILDYLPRATVIMVAVRDNEVVGATSVRWRDRPSEWAYPWLTPGRALR